MSITQADNECRLEGDKTHEIFHFLSKKVGGGHFLCGPHQAEKWGDASPPSPTDLRPWSQAVMQLVAGTFFYENVVMRIIRMAFHANVESYKLMPG